MTNVCTIPEEAEWEFRECFSWFDKDGDGYISSSCLASALRAMGQYWTLPELKELARQYPPEGQLNFREFLNICEIKYGIVPNPQEISRAFEVFDRTGSGWVLLEDIKHILCSLGEQLTPKEFEELCSIHGVSYRGGDQAIDRQTFTKIFGVLEASDTVVGSPP